MPITVTTCILKKETDACFMKRRTEHYEDNLSQVDVRPHKLADQILRVMQRFLFSSSHGNLISGMGLVKGE